MSSDFLLPTFFPGFVHAAHKAVPLEFGCTVARSADLGVLVLADWYVETRRGRRRKRIRRSRRRRRCPTLFLFHHC